MPAELGTVGYEVHVTRAEHWTESETTPISLAEWLAYVDQDAELRRDGHAEVAAPTGEALRYENDGLVVWTTYSQHEVDGNKAWLDHRDGAVVFKNPDEEVLRKLHAIALHFGARVQGDDGEEYDADGRPIEAADAPRPRGWWRRLFGRSD